MWVKKYIYFSLLSLSLFAKPLEKKLQTPWYFILLHVSMHLLKMTVLYVTVWPAKKMNRNEQVRTRQAKGLPQGFWLFIWTRESFRTGYSWKGEASAVNRISLESWLCHFLAEWPWVNGLPSRILNLPLNLPAKLVGRLKWCSAQCLGHSRYLKNVLISLPTFCL